MKDSDIKTIGVVGAGTMGHGVALSYALGGFQVVMYTRSEKSLDIGIENIRKTLNMYKVEGVLTQDQCLRTMKAIAPTNNFGDLEKAEFICENVLDDISIKKEVFTKLDMLCSNRTILASNTSTLTLNSFTKNVSRQERLIITHYFNPPFLIPAVEVVRGVKTSETTINTVCEILSKAKKIPVIINKEIPGHLVNRVQFAMWRELYYLYNEGIASVEDIDCVCRGSFGLRLAAIGPLLTDDMAGTPKWRQLGIEMCNRAFSDLSNEKVVPQKVQELLLSGKGFYNLEDYQLKECEDKRNIALLQQLRLYYPNLMP